MQCILGYLNLGYPSPRLCKHPAVTFVRAFRLIVKMRRISLDGASSERDVRFKTVVVVVSVTSILLVSLMSDRSKIIAISEETSSPAPLYFKSWERGVVTV